MPNNNYWSSTTESDNTNNAWNTNQNNGNTNNNNKTNNNSVRYVRLGLYSKTFMFYQNMPLYLKLVNLLKSEYAIFHNLPKEYKFSLGEDIINRTWELIDLFITAQDKNSYSHKTEKTEIVRKLNLSFEILKLRIRFLTELKLISLGQTTELSGNLSEIGKMIGSWLKNA